MKYILLYLIYFIKIFIFINYAKKKTCKKKVMISLFFLNSKDWPNHHLKENIYWPPDNIYIYIFFKKLIIFKENIFGPNAFLPP